jgi:hypothetical protein
MDENANLFCMGGCTKTNHTKDYILLIAKWVGIQAHFTQRAQELA